MSAKTDDKALSLCLFLFLFSVYLLTYSGSIHSSDGQAMFSVAESVVRRGEYDINQVRWMGLQQGMFGPDGDLYCHKGLGTPLVALPLLWLGMVVPAWGVVQTAMLLNVLVTALTALLLFSYVRLLGYAPRSALICALVFGLGTMAWPYAKYFFSEPLTGLSLLASAYFLLRLASAKGKGTAVLSALLSGFALGLGIATRFANTVLIPLYLGALAAYLVRRSGATAGSIVRGKVARLLSSAWPEVCAFVTPLIAWGIVMGGYNYARYGTPLATGYLAEPSFSAPWPTGILGLLISPGRGIVFYCPILLACVPALPSFFRRHRLEAILVVLTGLFYVLLYGKWFMWHGGFAWGPRFLVPIVPLVTIILAPLIERLKGATRAAFWVLFVVSVVVQLVGLSVHFIHHQEALLETGLPLFDPITFFDPRYSQLAGTLAFLRPENLDFAWVQVSRGVEIDWLALGVGLVLVAACAWALLFTPGRYKTSRTLRAYIMVILPLLVVGGTAFLLARYKSDGHGDYVQMLNFLEANSQPGDAIIQNSPPETAILQNHYKGHLPSYGLFEGEQPLSADTVALLERLTLVNSRFWLIPDGLPPQRSSLDRWFTDRGYSARHHSFGPERLTLYARP